MITRQMMIIAGGEPELCCRRHAKRVYACLYALHMRGVHDYASFGLAQARPNYTQNGNILLVVINLISNTVASHMGQVLHIYLMTETLEMETWIV